VVTKDGSSSWICTGAIQSRRQALSIEDVVTEYECGGLTVDELAADHKRIRQPGRFWLRGILKR
jgi:hypothetical protein